MVTTLSDESKSIETLEYEINTMEEQLARKKATLERRKTNLALLERHPDASCFNCRYSIGYLPHISTEFDTCEYGKKFREEKVCDHWKRDNDITEYIKNIVDANEGYELVCLLKKIIGKDVLFGDNVMNNEFIFDKNKEKYYNIDEIINLINQIEIYRGKLDG